MNRPPFRGSSLPDSPRAWAMLGLACVALFAALGTRMSFGAYVTSWEAAFGVDRSQISSISSLSLVVYGLGMPVTGRFADRFGARAVLSASLFLIGVGLIGCWAASSLWHLFLCYGLIASVGFCGASSVTVSVAVMRWFRRQRGLAMGVTSCGIAGGQLVLVPLTIYLIGLLGWRAALLTYGIAAATVLTGIIWLFFEDAPYEEPAEREGAPAPAEVPGEGRGKPAGSPSLLWLLPWLLAVPYFVCGFTDLGLVTTHFIPLAEGRGFSSEIVALAIAIDALANIGGNLLAGHLADRMRLTLLLATMYTVRAGGIIVLLLAQDPGLLLAFAVINGSVEASTIAPTAALCARVYGPGRMGTVFGLVSSAHQFGAAAGAFLIGALFTRSGGYGGSLVLSCVLLLMGGLLTWALGRVLARRPRAAV